MANVIIRSEERKRETEKILRQFHSNSSDPGMREAADVVAAGQNEMIKNAQERRRYFYGSDQTAGRR